jgi:hypothetical protein
MSNEEPEDYDYVTAKLPRKGKDGSDITGDRPGKGGRHRPDGTYSGPVFDISIEDGKPVSRGEHDEAVRERDALSDRNDALNYENHELRMRGREREEERRRQQFEEDWGPLIELLVEKTFEVGAVAWTTWGAPFVKRTGAKIRDRFTGAVAKAAEPKTEKLIIDASTETDIVSHRPQMSDEEAGRRLSRVALLVELLADEMRALDGVEMEGKTLDVDAVTRALGKKSTEGAPLTDEEVAELHAVLVKLDEQPAAAPMQLDQHPPPENPDSNA